MVSVRGTQLPGTITAGAAVKASLNNTLPAGEIGRDTTLGPDIDISTGLNLILSVPAIVQANRCIYIIACGSINTTLAPTVAVSGGAGTVTNIANAQTSLYAGATAINRLDMCIPIDGNPQGFVVCGFDYPTVSGPVTYGLYCGPSGSSNGTLHVVANPPDPQSPVMMHVFDMGSSY